jgi:L-lactate dehydrogenase (cytochrome)
MMDSGIRSGPDVACAVASGAHFTFMGRSWMYGVAALGELGGDHTMTMLIRQFKQVLEQLGCPSPTQLPQFLLQKN